MESLQAATNARSWLLSDHLNEVFSLPLLGRLRTFGDAPRPNGQHRRAWGTAAALVVRQYNPEREFEIPLARVRVVYPILKQSELMGI